MGEFPLVMKLLQYRQWNRDRIPVPAEEHDSELRLCGIVQNPIDLAISDEGQYFVKRR